MAFPESLREPDRARLRAGDAREPPGRAGDLLPEDARLLAGRHAGPDAPQAGSRFEDNRLYQRRYWSPPMFALAERYRAIAADEGMSLLELSYAWLAGRAVVDSILVGPVQADHLDSAASACAKTLSPGAARRIDAVHRDHLGTDASYAR